MLISYKHIMPASLAKAIARPAQYCVNETSYCISANKQAHQQNSIREQPDAGLY
jgi:hypothetical protein